MNPQEDNVELEAIAQNGVDTNDKLDSIDTNGEAQVQEQMSTTDAVKGLETPLDTVARNTDPDVPHKVQLEARNDISKVFFEMIRGDKGERGDKGQIGDRGAKGDRGDTGSKGDPGRDAHMVGPKGATGAKGAMGTSGKDGRDGVDGQDGIDGAQGKSGKDASVKAVVKEATKVVTEKIEKKVDKDIDRVVRHVSSKSYALHDLSDVTVSDTEPSNPSAGQFWVDIS